MKRIDPIMFKVKRSIFFLLITIPLFCSKVGARQIIGNEERVFPIIPSHIIEDHEGKYSGNSILNSKEWSVYSTKNKVPNFGFFKGVLWLKYDLYKENNNTLYFAIQQPTAGKAIFNIYQNNSLIYSDSSGLYIKQSSRKIPNTFPVFIIPENLKGNLEVVLSMRSSEPMFLPVSVLSANGLVEATINTARKDYILLGGIIFVTFFNFALWIGFRDLGFLLYGFFSGSVFLSISKTNGYLDYFLWPNQPLFNNYSAVFEIFSAITGALFTIHFLRLKEYLPKIRKFIIGQIIFCCIAMFISLSGYNQASLMMVQTSAFLFVFIAIYASARVYLLGFKAARFYLLSWGFFLVGVLIYIVLNAGLIEYSFLKANLLNIAIGFEIFFSSIAVADKIIILRKEREREIKARINLLNDQNDMLEKLVSERTKEIAAANEELISQNEHLEEQKMLVMNINSNLEKIVSERTEMIRRQFDRLEEYAYFNAHKVRGPLARILGLINIFYLEDEKKDTDDYLLKIKQNAEELDEVVRGISNQVLNDLEEKS